MMLPLPLSGPQTVTAPRIAFFILRLITASHKQRPGDSPSVTGCQCGPRDSNLTDASGSAGAGTRVSTRRANQVEGAALRSSSQRNSLTVNQTAPRVPSSGKLRASCLSTPEADTIRYTADC
eukprot:678756-Rhodomonas_salina.1